MIVFVIGPYRADSAWEIEQNVRRAEEVALRVWEAGHVALCPHAMTRYYQDALPDDVWLSGMRKLMMRCDSVLALDGWEGSEGSMLELDLAEEIGFPIFTEVEQIDGGM